MTNHASQNSIPVPASLLALLLVTAQGCGPGTPSSDQIIDPEQLSAYQRASCQYGFDEGETVLLANHAPEIRTGHFGKRFDYAPIRAVRDASARTTVEFFNTQGVTIFQIPESSSRCALFSSLERAPEDFESYWKSTTSRSDPETGTIVGLYVEKGSPEVRTAGSAAEIGIRNDANRWVVVHEFMHHQFETMAASTSGKSASDVKRSVEAKNSAFKDAADRFDARKDVESFRHLVHAYRAAMKELRELVIRYPLEEVAIETFMQNEHKTGNFGFMPFLEDSSNGYILSSAAKALKMTNKFSRVGLALKDLAIESGLWDLVRLLEKENQADDNLKSQLKIALRETEAGSFRGSIARTLGLGTRSEVHPGCAHEREIEGIALRLDEITKGVTQRLEPPR